MRVCDDELVGRLLAAGLDWRDRRHLLERWEMQQRGDATLLVTLSSDRMVGRATLLHVSKYGEVQERLDALREVNALSAVFHGRGIGTALLGGRRSWPRPVECR